MDLGSDIELWEESGFWDFKGPKNEFLFFRGEFRLVFIHELFDIRSCFFHSQSGLSFGKPLVGVLVKEVVVEHPIDVGCSLGNGRTKVLVRFHDNQLVRVVNCLK